jgi:hypothetical protein
MELGIHTGDVLLLGDLEAALVTHDGTLVATLTERRRETALGIGLGGGGIVAIVILLLSLDPRRQLKIGVA